MPATHIVRLNLTSEDSPRNCCIHSVMRTRALDMFSYYSSFAYALLHWNSLMWIVLGSAPISPSYTHALDIANILHLCHTRCLT